MGILDDLTSGIFDPFAGPGRRQKRGNRIQAEGSTSPGVLTGIRVREHAEYSDDWFFGVEVQPAGEAPFRAACRQSVAPMRDSLRLGMPVEVRHDAETIVLAWDPGGPGNWKPAGGIDDGIDDARLGKLRGDPADAELLGWRAANILGIERVERDVRLRIGDQEPHRRTLFVPEWAGHLLVPGTVWPVFVRGDKVAVDWLAAIKRHGGGVGEPTPEPSDPAPDGARAEERLVATAGRLAGAAPEGAPGNGDPLGVSFETWVAVSAGLARDRVRPSDYDAYAQRHGVPVGGWAAAEGQWKARMMSDWQLGARFGEAYEKALKAR